MPGVPSEMKNMFFDSVRGVFSTFGKQQAIVVRKLKCTGAGESAIAQMLGDEMARGKNPLVNCTCHGCVITLHIVAAAEDPDSASAMADEKVEQLSRLLASINVPSGAKSSGPQGAIEAESSGSQGAIEAKSFGPQGAVEARKIPAPLIFGFDDDTLEGVVGKELTKLSKTVALAESCTGGLIAKMLTDAPGATKFFKYGWVTYANEAKVSQLGVSPDLIEAYGAVSSQVAEAMARGAREKAGADFGVAVTGIAGPDGGTDEKPVGLVYIAVAGDNDIVGECQCVIEKCVFSGSRGDIRLRTAMEALNILRGRLLGGL
jgi:nicotinamide-nucleotide amidase